MTAEMTDCPKCTMRVVPRNDGTCPSCGWIIVQAHISAGEFAEISRRLGERLRGQEVVTLRPLPPRFFLILVALCLAIALPWLVPSADRTALGLASGQAIALAFCLPSILLIFAHGVHFAGHSTRRIVCRVLLWLLTLGEFALAFLIAAQPRPNAEGHVSGLIILLGGYLVLAIPLLAAGMLQPRPS